MILNEDETKRGEYCPVVVVLFSFLAPIISLNLKMHQPKNL